MSRCKSVPSPAPRDFGLTIPEVYLRLAAGAGVGPGEILSFEDSGIGVPSAAGASIPCLAVPNRFMRGQDFRRAVAVLSDLTHAGVMTPPGERYCDSGGGFSC
jgi:hypothetical protein